MTQDITIPANSDVLIGANNALAYYGVIFLKNASEMHEGSRKFSFLKSH